MNVISYILPLLFVVSLGAGLHAQPLKNPCDSKSAQKQYDKAREARMERNFDKVEGYYQKALKECPDWDELYVEIADFHIRAEEPAKAEPYLEEAVKRMRDQRPALLFFLGRLEYQQEKFREAADHLDAYLSMIESNEPHYRRSKELLAHSRFAAWALENPVHIEPERLGDAINTERSEYLPVLTADEQTMVFTRRVGSVEDIFWAVKKSGEWEETTAVEMGDLPYRKGAYHISPDGKLIVFAMADHPAGMGGFDLYYLRKFGGSWHGPLNLGRAVNTPGWESQPSIGPDNRTLYFSADRKGGEGHKDIWRTRLNEDGTWDPPVNLGPAVNTRLDEASPYLHRDGQTLYFRSKGHPGMGDFDLFISRKDDYNNWSVPENLGYPINTTGSEGGLFVSIEGNEAWYASDILDADSSRIELEQQDIFRIELPEHLRPRPATYIRALVYDAVSKQPVKCGVLLLDFDRADTVLQSATDRDGEFMSCVTVGHDYAMQVHAKGYLLHTERFEVDSTHRANDPFVLRIALRPVEAELAAPESLPVVLENVLFRFGTAELLPGSKTELQALAAMLNRHPKLEISIHGHTDHIGSDADNLELSRERARAVHEYLTEVGISAERMDYEGFGETQPIASNETEAGRKQNRRVQFVIRK